MDPHEPFLKAILADRQNDLPRLVYADWLEEQGEPAGVAHAHFIRTQIHLESTDPKSQLFADMKALETRILDFYLEEWGYNLPEFARSGSALERVVWRRGFPDDLGPMSVKQFLQHGTTALNELPLTTVHLIDYQLPIAFEKVPALAHVVRLKLGPPFHSLTPTQPGVDEPTVTFESLMNAPVLTTLTHLDLSEINIFDWWLVRFVTAFPTASFARTLHSLDLSGNFGITNAGANVLATSSAFDRLKRLRIRDTGITSAGKSMLKKRFGDRLA